MINDMMLGFALDRTRHSGRAETWRGARSVLFSQENLKFCLLGVCSECSVIKSDKAMHKVAQSES